MVPIIIITVVIIILIIIKTNFSTLQEVFIIVKIIIAMIILKSLFYQAAEVIVAIINFIIICHPDFHLHFHLLFIIAATMIILIRFAVGANLLLTNFS